MTFETPTYTASCSNYARFRHAATSIELHEDHRSQWGPNLYRMLKKQGVFTARRVSKRFAKLSDQQMPIACGELKRFVDLELPSPLLYRIAYRMITGLEVVYHAGLISHVLPTYLKLASPGQPIGKEFVIVTNSDGNLLNPLAIIFGTFSEERINRLHGTMMQEFTPNKEAIIDEDMEWFGANRERIIPLWQQIVSGGVFTRDRVQAFLEAPAEGSLTLLEGSL